MFWFGVICAAATLSLALLLTREPGSALYINLGVWGFEVGLHLFLCFAAGNVLRAWRKQKPALPEPRPLSILIAAHNERASIQRTLESVFEQGLESVEVILVSDGSTDGMDEHVIYEFALKPVEPGSSIYRSEEGWPLCLVRIRKCGKAVALNEALLHATHDLFVTLDADTQLAPGALAALTAPFADPQVEAAGGFLYVRNAEHGGWLEQFQFTEYIRAYLWRAGLSHCGLCLLVSGALGAFRAATVRRLGGFRGDTLTEDYELVHRIYEDGFRRGLRVRVVTPFGAVGYTEVPSTFGSFWRQRARWFTGFLQTHWKYRQMTGNPSCGRIGLFMLPVKCLDAVVPLWAMLAVGILIWALNTGDRFDAHFALALFLARWSLDVVSQMALLTWHDRSLSMNAPKMSPWVRLRCVLLDPFTFHWLRQFAVLRAYLWCWRGGSSWTQPRWVVSDVSGSRFKV
jgi:cellulose synthase/poly-beta-1,6-N-acetylglucosamine synthase-like glycosyltransferase